MNRISKHIVISFMLTLSFLSFGNSTFQEGIKAFNDKNYKLSADKFDSIISISPRDVSAYFNYGLAKMKTKEYGDAIWGFEKVLKYNPSDAEAKEKIQECYFELNPDIFWTYRLNGFQSSLYSISPNTWAVFSIICSLILAFSIVLFRLKKSHSIRRMMLLSGSVSALFLIISILIGALSKNHVTSTNYAIVTKNTTSVIEKVKVEEGALIEVIELESNQYRVKLDDRQVVSLKKGDVKVI